MRFLWYLWNKNLSYWLTGLCLCTAFGCSQLQVRDNTFFPPQRNYTISIPQKGWEVVKIDKEDITLQNKQYNATIAIISSDVESKKVPLDILTRQLFIGIKNKKILLEEPVQIGNQKATHTILVGELDDYPLKIDSYVMRANNTVYDFVYWAPLDSFDSAHGDFRTMIKTFQLL